MLQGYLRSNTLTRRVSTWSLYRICPFSLFHPCSITEHVDFATQLQEPGVEPLCNANLPASMHTLDHLYGVANRAAIHYTGESQLKEVGTVSVSHVSHEGLAAGRPW